MSNDSGIPDASQVQQLAHDRHTHFIESLRQIKLEGAKGLVTLNGGAAIAMLAFLQALVDRPTFPAFKSFALPSLSLFLAGAFVAGVAFFFQYAYVLHSYYGSKGFWVWRWISWCSLVLSAAAAFAGGCVVVAGVRCVL